mmetsp:Transcript_50377/g.113251  ORF Transcript_50377/g.113251 Transcript_50377/m.113251 type:complete len:370 (+) Transcript_50377:70-1179(+)
MTAEPNRRRLTVGVGAGMPSTAAASSGGSAKAEKVIERCGLAPFLQASEEKDKKFAAVVAVLDIEQKKKKSFTNKDTVTVSTMEESAALSWVHSLGIGFCCMKGLKPESPNQDCFAVVVAEGDFGFYCVLDGHGPEGHAVSHFCLEHIINLFLRNPARTTNPAKAFTEAFTLTQQAVQEAEDKLQASHSGTTVSLAYHDFTKDVLTVAHCGDSRAVFGEGLSATDLTIDHKPNLPAEKERIEKAGGRVVFDGYFNHRVFARDKPSPGLNMSRALGDVMAHTEAGLSAEPDIKTVDMKKKREGSGELRLLVCTDGVWEFIESKEAIQFASAPTTPQESLDALAKQSWDNWMKDSDKEIADDITGVLVTLS